MGRWLLTSDGIWKDVEGRGYNFLKIHLSNTP
jgi:hypothetical protein